MTAPMTTEQQPPIRDEDMIGALQDDLVAKVLFRGDKRRAIQWARAWLGLDSADPASFEQHRREMVKRREHAERDDMRRQRLAAGIFLAAQAQLAGTPAAVYLASRAI